MGQKYYVEARLSGSCLMPQATKQCETLIGFLLTVIKFRLKYPIVNAKVRNGYKDCSTCEFSHKPLCYSSKEVQ